MNRLKRNNKRLFRKSTVKQKTTKTLNHKQLRNLAIAFAVVIVAGFLYLRFLQPHTLDAKQRVQLESTQHQLIQTKKSLEQSQSKSKAEDDAKLKQIEQLNEQIKQKDAELQAKAANKSAVAYAAQAPTVAKVYPLPEDDAKAFIYSHESGNRTDAFGSWTNVLVNGVYIRDRACGLGQALPCSKMPCSLSDYACQDAYFTTYMQGRYGTWNNARAFWQANQWW